jgi:hypothetical protein
MAVALLAVGNATSGAETHILEVDWTSPDLGSFAPD